MESLAPAHEFLLRVINGIENGKSVRQLIPTLILGKSDFHLDLQRWWLFEQQGPSQTLFVPANIYRQTLFQILKQGLNGSAIHAHLIDLETELSQACQDDIERHIRKLPVVMLVPLLFLQFPAFLLLLLGPWMQELVRALAP